MKKLLSLLAIAWSFCALYAQAPANYTYVFGNKVMDASGSLLASGSITFTPTNATGVPMAFRAGGGGSVITRPVQATVTNGVFSLNLADVSLSSPTYFCYAVTVVDNATGNQVMGGSDFSCIQPNGATYDLDNYSATTTPIMPPANATMNGNLSINGNLSLTGNLYGNIGTLVSAAINTNNITVSNLMTSALDNYVINPTLSAGVDLPQQISAAIATYCTASVDIPYGLYGPGCTIKVPPGIYPMTTGEIYIPATGADINLILDGVDLRPGPGIAYGIVFAPGSDHFFLHGGLIDFFNDEAACKAGIVLGPGIQGGYIDGIREARCVNGDGLLNLGANVVTVSNSTFATNLMGVHLTGNPGYASNANKFLYNIITGNAREAVVVGDETQFPVGWPKGDGSTVTSPGASSPDFNNLFFANDLEGNGKSSTSSVIYPAVMDVLTIGDDYEYNYFEATPYEEIHLGSLGNHTDAAYAFMFGANSLGPQGGTPSGTTIANNYFTSNGGVEINLYAAVRPTITGNSGANSAADTCFIEDSNSVTGGFYNNNAYPSGNYDPPATDMTSKYCRGLTPVSDAYFGVITGPDTMENDLALTGDTIFYNAVIGSNYGTPGTNNIAMDRVTPQGPPIPSNPNAPSGSANPYCDPSFAIGSVWRSSCKSGQAGCNTDGGHEWICQGDLALATPISDGHSTWVLVK